MRARLSNDTLLVFLIENRSRAYQAVVLVKHCASIPCTIELGKVKLANILLK